QAWSFSSYASPLSLKRQLKWQPKQHSQQHLPPGQSTDATCLWDPIQAPNPLKVTRNQVLSPGFVAGRRAQLSRPARALIQPYCVAIWAARVTRKPRKPKIRHTIVSTA